MWCLRYLDTVSNRIRCELFDSEVEASERFHRLSTQFRLVAIDETEDASDGDERGQYGDLTG